MRQYFIPLALALTSCGGASKHESIIEDSTNVPTTATTPSDNNGPPDFEPAQPGTEIDPPMRQLFADTGFPIDGDVVVRNLSIPEAQLFETISARAEFLAPYAAQLSQTDALASDFKDFYPGGAEAVYATLIAELSQAQKDQLIFVEPGLAGSPHDGQYQSAVVEQNHRDADGEIVSVKIVAEFKAYTFPDDDDSVWKASTVLHEMAHGILPTQHTVSFRWSDQAELANHVRSQRDLVYKISQEVSILEFPMIATDQIISEAKTGQRNQEQALTELAFLGDASGEAWGDRWMKTVETAYEPYIDGVGLSREVIRSIYNDSAFQEQCQEYIREAIERFKAELALPDERLRELQTKYGLTADSLELQPSQYIMTIVTDWQRPGETMVEVQARMDQKIEEIEAEHEAQHEAERSEIDELNAAIRRIRSGRRQDSPR